MEEVYKEVYFNQYCPTCKYKDLPTIDDYGKATICFECLDNPVALNSHKPVNWKSQGDY